MITKGRSSLFLKVFIRHAEVEMFEELVAGSIDSTFNLES